MVKDFRHDRAYEIFQMEDVPIGEGEFLVMWNDSEKEEWVKTHDIIRNGERAVRAFFEDVMLKRKISIANHMKKITHISSLDDIIPEIIVDETELEYKMKISSLSDDFIYELDHPEWGKNITKLYDVVREGDDIFIWANRVHVQYLQPKTVTQWERKQRIRPTIDEILDMDWADYKKYVDRKAAGYYGLSKKAQKPNT
ncbi:hypothetical protein PFISCL1PPCAC_26301, partial [Pristionchus fissidentatus]